MALPTGSGTETLHAHMFAECDSDQTFIFGVQHHVYVVISVIVCCRALNATTDTGYLLLEGHSGHTGASGEIIELAIFNIQVNETYVWNDKFCFNGVEPTGTNTFDADEQVAIAAQSGSAVQELKWTNSHAADDFDVLVTYLDQDWT